MSAARDRLTLVRLSDREMAARWGGGFDDKDIHVVYIVSELTGEGLLGRGPKEGLEHIFGERAPGNKTVLALGRQGDGAMSA